MKIKSLELRWFRGASESITFNADSKNIVVYGSNGSGKSSFVDAIEYIISDGRIEHLSHEYSGSRHRNSIINTHIPDNTDASLLLTLSNNDAISVEINVDGTKTITSTPGDLIDTVQKWKTENYILRQDEVAKFIHITKGAKYSVLLPLLGLEELEKAADNFNRLRRRIKSDSKSEIVKNNLKRLRRNIRKHFDDIKDPSILAMTSQLCDAYNLSYTGDIRKDSHQLISTIDEKLRNLSPENTKYQLLNQCNNEQLAEKLDAYELSKSAFAEVASEVIDKKIEVLQATRRYLQDYKERGEIECPACGRSIDSEIIKVHKKSEMSNLVVAREKKQKYEHDQKAFLSSFSQVVNILGTEEMLTGMTQSGYEKFAQKVEEIKSRIERSQPVDFHMDTVELTSFIESEVGESPPEIIDLLSHSEMLIAIRTIPGILSLEDYYSQIESTIEYLEKCEAVCQAKIREKAEIKIREITIKIQELWSKIHPDESIEDVRLNIPDSADRAIDISLKFYGVEQPSPRVTLSEGHRNSLGLCIFLALALSNQSDEPIILDDIVSSLDREHRNRLTQVLLDDLADRQIILFTHDRDYYTELRYLLPQREWRFAVLSPWSDPTTGIQWARSTFSFDDARALLPDFPESSGNKVRAIMDSETSVVSEKLQIPLPHRRGPRNDMRTCMEFLDSLIPLASTSFKIKQNGSYSIHTTAIDELDAARGLILAYGNPASHGREVVPDEVTQLIDACETALNGFRCPECGDFVWMADQSTRERLQCPCGRLRWQYG